MLLSMGWVGSKEEKLVEAGGLVLNCGRLLRGSCPVPVWWDRPWKFSAMIWRREASPLCLHVTSQLHVPSTKNVGSWYISLGRQTLHLQVQSFQQTSEHEVWTESALETARLKLYAWIIEDACYKHGVEALRPGDSDAVDPWVGLGIYMLTPHLHPQYIWHRRVDFFCLVYRLIWLGSNHYKHFCLGDSWNLNSVVTSLAIIWTWQPAGSLDRDYIQTLRLPSLALPFIEFPIILQWPCLPTKVHIVKAMVFPVVMYRCESWTIKKAEHWRIDAFKRGVREDSWKSLDCKRIKPVNPKGNKLWIFIARTGTEAKAPILWPPDGKSQFIRKDPDAGKDWRQEEKGTTEDKLVGWHHWLNGHEFEQTPGVGEGQGSLACCSPWGHKESDTT